MIRHLVLSGGPGHALDVTSAALVALLDEQHIRSTVVTEPSDVVAALRCAEDGTGDPVDLLTVNALRWRMDQDRYASQRADHAVTLDPGDLAVIDRFVRRGGGLLALHTAVICFDADPVWHALCGASWRWDRSSHPPLGAAEVEVTGAGRDHPITRGVEPFVIHDEVYGFLDEVPGLEPLLVGAHGGRSHPLLWARPVGAGRVVTDLLGHGPESYEHPVHRLILARAAAWAVDRPPQAGTGAAGPTTTTTTTVPTTSRTGRA